MHATLIFLCKADFIILSFLPDKYATKEEVAHFKCTKEQPGYIYIYICTSETEATVTVCFENVTALLPAWNVCLNNWVLFRLEWIFSIILYLFAPALPARLYPLSCALKWMLKMFSEFLFPFYSLRYQRVLYTLNILQQRIREDLSSFVYTTSWCLSVDKKFSFVAVSADFTCRFRSTWGKNHVIVTTCNHSRHQNVKVRA